MILRNACVVGFMVMIAVGGALPASAQQTDNDYYASRGTALLRTVEQYHLFPGEEKVRQKNYQSAFGDFSFILRYFPNHPQALLALVQLCSEWRSPECMLDIVLEKAIALRPDASNTFVVNGIYLHRIKRYKDAVGAYERALALDPDSVNAHYNLALTLIETHQYALANEHAQRAYALGATLPGLRERLQKVGQWNPAAVESSPQQTPPDRAEEAAPASTATMTPAEKN